MLVAGARPNFMKVAPIIKCIQRRNLANNGDGPSIAVTLVHTGQHYDAKMSTVFFQELGIPAPDVNLEVGSGSHAVQSANIMTRFEPVLVREQPDWLIVVGDVNSTMSCTLVASKLGIKVAHLEAGLRSFDRTMPEEINRLVTDVLADLLLTPSEDGNENLRREGIPEDKIKLVGNIMIDSLVENLPQSRASKILANLGILPGNFVYVTLHRPSNVDQKESIIPIMNELKRLSAQMPIIFPMHPRTQKMLAEFNISINDTPAVKILEPIGYHDSLCLTENARLVLTDSGGLQEESTYFRTPCLTLRPNTERPITITMGSNKLTTVKALSNDLVAIVQKPSRLGRIPEYWDGCASERVLNQLYQTYH